MAWREYLNLFLKYEGQLDLATEREIEHADRGMDPQLARRIAELDYRRRKRAGNNETNQVDRKVTCDDSSTPRIANSLFE